MAVSDAILTRLLARHPKIIDLSLDRMRHLLALLGNPERRLPPVIHIAGTNGKGSTLACLRAILEAAQLSVHAYTSPHLVSFHERMRLAAGPGNSAFISEPALAAVLEECERAGGDRPITFFEITTAAAFLAFSRSSADYLLLEVGLGGRLDATNVVDHPRLSVLTTIDLDHQMYLGDTLALIAAEKAGIFKAGTPAVVGHQHEEALAVIRRVAASIGAPLSVAGEHWLAFEQRGRLVFQDGEGLLDLPRPSLVGPFQIDNAGLAIAAIRRLADRRIDEDAMAKGLRNVDWPARMECLETGRLTRLATGSEIWVDGGHNPSGGAAVAASLAELGKRSPRPVALVWGMLASKDARAFIRSFRGIAGHGVALAVPGEPNAMTASELVDIARSEGISAQPASSIEEAVEMAGAVAANGRILITGSLYLAGHVLALHRGQAMSAVTGTSRR
jgi:dihydrofolate synthase/folylpolyglutamate synthase